MTQPTRKLAAIVFTDIVEFTQITAQDEAAAMSLLKWQRERFKPLVNELGGEWLKEVGDGLLLSFPSSQDAVRCAIRIQEAAQEVPNLKMRIGIHQGDIIQEGSDILGDGVNIASRIQEVALRGGIALSEKVQQDISGYPEFEVISLGQKSLKGVARPMEIYALSPFGLPEIPEYRLLRLTGQGAYGEVWLAQSLTGVYRAVKIVHRDQFEDAKPYEREFTGITGYEPISRKHEGLIDLLHVGHGKDDSFFYYVMELADDQRAREEINPREYQPRTLQSELDARGKLSIGECLEAGSRLARGLAFLHDNNLLHRDIKPSNIVYVDGQPKLADIGLVTTMDNASTLVGTMGYIPPEGPGKPHADIYALGMVLYELSTGKDRADFPEIDVLDPELKGLNQACLKACSRDTAERFPDAHAFADELDQLAREPLGGSTASATEGSSYKVAALAASLLLILALLILLRDKTPSIPNGPIKTNVKTRLPESPDVPTSQVSEIKPGTKIWEFETGGEVNSSPAIGPDGTVYVGSYDDKIYALDGATGAKKWEFVTGGDVYSSPAIGPDGTVYVGSNDKKIHALNGKTGAKKWEFITGGAVRSSPAIGSDGTVYIGSADKKLYAINGKSGLKKWEFETGGYVNSSPAIGSDGTVYFGSSDRKVYALDGATGTKIWEYETGFRGADPRDSGVHSSPAIGADGTLYVGSMDYKLYALDGETGDKKWEFETKDSIGQLSPTIGVAGTVYFGNWNHRVYALDGKTGAKKWEFRAGLFVNTSAAIGADGSIYIGSEDNKVHALDGASGLKNWEFETGHHVESSPAIGPDGTVYVGSGDKKVYALASSSQGLANSPWPRFGGNNQNTGRIRIDKLNESVLGVYVYNNSKTIFRENGIAEGFRNGVKEAEYKWELRAKEVALIPNTGETFIFRIESNGDLTRIAVITNGRRVEYSTKVTSKKIALKKGLVAYYPFNGNAKDESGNGHGGIVNGAVLTEDRHGKADSAYSFDGKDDYLVTEGDLSVVGNTNRTISCWVYVNNQNEGIENILSWGDPITPNNPTPGGTSEFGLSSGAPFFSAGNSRQVMATKDRIREKKWEHLCFVYSESLKKSSVYLNGHAVAVESGSGDSVYSINTSPRTKLKIGVQNLTKPFVGWNQSFKGMIDDIRIYSRALSGEEVKDLYYLEKPKLGPYRVDKDTMLLEYFEGATTGKSNRPASFDKGRIGQGLRMTPKMSLSWDKGPLAEGTFEFWFKLDDEKFQGTLASANFLALPAAITLLIRTGEKGDVYSELFTNGPDWARPKHIENKIRAKQWNHVGVSWGRKGINTYLNGVRIGFLEGTHLLNPRTGTWVMGSQMRASDGFSGVIDEVRISRIQRDFNPEDFTP